MTRQKPGQIVIYADIVGHNFNGGTIPSDILTTSTRPDIVIINRHTKQIDLLELTVSFEKNIEKASKIKEKRYLDIKQDLEVAGWSTNLVPFEVGSRGQVTKRNRSSIYNVTKRHHINLNHTQITKDMSKISLLCSFSVFQAHCQPSWQDPPLLHP